jgi:hypothetical protein
MVKVETFYCPNNCCQIKIKPYIDNISIYKKYYPNNKSGIFIYDPKNKKILLVQSNGNLWGIPKGTLKRGETPICCALREVYEETGLVIDSNDMSKTIIIKNNCKYFYIEKSFCDVFVQNNPNNNDANGITWIKIDCLKNCLTNGNIDINSHTRIVIKQFLDIDLPKSKFITIRN